MMSASSSNHRRKPLGIQFTEYISSSAITLRKCRIIVMIVTFFAYACYHLTRKTTSIIKSVLDPESSAMGSTKYSRAYFFTPSQHSRKSGWAPFDSPDATSLLGEIDVAFLAAYSLGMYFAGHLGDRLDLRRFLTAGMVGTGLFTMLFGVGYWFDVHSFYFFLGVQILAGLFQSTGWPSVVAIVGNWFGKSKRGLIMGVWNAHTSVGNIAGSLIASVLLKYGWGWSFAIPGLIIVLVGLVVFLFLPISPSAMGLEREGDDLEKSVGKSAITEPLVRDDARIGEHAVGFLEAWRIPGVSTFAFCLFFSKLVAYTFLYWLPFYISHSAIGDKYLSNSDAGNLSTLFDLGGVVGGIIAGHISDHLGARAITAATFTYCAIPALYLYRAYGSVSIYWNMALMFTAGMFVNGPYALITTAVSADLGTHSSSSTWNSRALATVTAIIDGTGSVGAAIGPLLTGYVSAKSWDHVFTMLMAAAFLSGLLLTKLVISEVRDKIRMLRLHG